MRTRYHLKKQIKIYYNKSISDSNKIQFEFFIKNSQCREKNIE
jgi:hypothetical protein